MSINYPKIPKIWRKYDVLLNLVLQSCLRGDATLNALNTRSALIFNIMIVFIENKEKKCD